MSVLAFGVRILQMAVPDRLAVGYTNKYRHQRDMAPEGFMTCFLASTCATITTSVPDKSDVSTIKV